MKTRIEDVLIEWTPLLPEPNFSLYTVRGTTLLIALRLGLSMQIVSCILARIQAKLSPQYAVEISIDMVPTPIKKGHTGDFGGADEYGR